MASMVLSASWADRSGAKLPAWRASDSVFDALRVAPEALQVVVGARLLRKNVDHVVAVIHQDPFGVGITFHARRNVSVLLQLHLDLIGYCLILPRIRAVADDQYLGERGHVAQIQHADLLRLFGFGGMDGGEPERVGFLRYCVLE